MKISDTFDIYQNIMIFATLIMTGNIANSIDFAVEKHWTNISNIQMSLLATKFSNTNK